MSNATATGPAVTRKAKPVHFRGDQFVYCGLMNGTAGVDKRRNALTTDDWESVTCKVCHRRRERLMKQS